MLARLKPDVAFNALHGPFGEDGCIQGVLEVLAIPYTHSGVLASALAMNKPHAKDVMTAAGIPVAESLLVSRFEAAKAHAMAPPYVVKPPNEGSSFGVLIVKEDATHPPQELYADEWRYGEIVMVERYVAGRELTCAVRGDEALGCHRYHHRRPLLRLRRQIRRRAGQSTFFRHKFHRIFTKMYRCLRYAPIRLWAAVGSAGPTSATTTGSRGRTGSSASKSTRSPA